MESGPINSGFGGTTPDFHWSAYVEPPHMFRPAPVNDFYKVLTEFFKKKKSKISQQKQWYWNPVLSVCTSVIPIDP